MNNPSHTASHLPNLAIARGPVGLADLLQPFGVTVSDLKALLRQHRKSANLALPGSSRTLDARACGDTIVITRACLKEGVEILNSEGAYYLRLSEKLPETIMTALPTRQVNDLIGGVGFPTEPTIKIAATSTTPSDDGLIKLDWPIVDC